MMYKKICFSIVLLLFILLYEANAQISIGVQTGINHSLFNTLDDKKITNQNGTYSVSNLNSVSVSLDIEYKLNKKINFTLGYGYLVTGYRENATYYEEDNLSKGGGFVQAGNAYNGIYLADYIYDTRFEYNNLYVKVGYQLFDNLKLTLGINGLIKPNRENEDGFYPVISRYQSIINLNQIKNEKELTITQAGIDPYRNYKNDIALSYGLDCKVYREFYLQIQHMIGFKRILDFPSDNRLKNQSINFSCSYRFFLLRKKVQRKRSK